MKFTLSTLSTARHAAVVLCTIILLAASSSATIHYVSTCGTVITTAGTWILTNSLPACPSFGVDILVNGTVRLELAGYSIYGTSPYSSGVICDAGSTCTVIGYSGPNSQGNLNTVSGFGCGLRADYGGLTVEHVHITQNETGICNGGTTGGNTVRYNTITGNPGGAINDNDAEQTKYIGNTMAGNGTAMFLQNPIGTVISRNIVVNNSGLGLFIQGAQNVLITENEFSFNAYGGVYLRDPVGGVKISDNAVSANGAANGADGITVAGFSYTPYQNEITRNTVGNNVGNGIAVMSGNGTPAEYNNVQGNVAIGNGTGGSGYDLFWDGLGAGNTWPYNRCDTSYSSGGPSIVCH